MYLFTLQIREDFKNNEKEETWVGVILDLLFTFLRNNFKMP